MLKHSLYVLFFLILTSVQAQSILIVDNTELEPSGDNYYTSIEAAINDAELGAIIYVVPSPKTYGNIDLIAKTNITLIGGGYNSKAATNINAHNSSVATFDIRNSSDIVIKGFEVTSIAGIDIGFGDEEGSRNIFISECVISTLNIDRADAITLENSFIHENFQTDNNFSTNIVVRNSVISERTQFTSVLNTTFENNLFAGMSIGSLVTHNLFKNNIFAGNTTSFEGAIWGDRNNTFINNFSTLLIDWEFGSNNGSDNIASDIALEAIFVDDRVNSNDDWSLDWLLDTDGAQFTGKGPTEGTSPMDGSPIFSLPFIYDLVAPTTLKAGEETEVTIKARGN